MRCSYSGVAEAAPWAGGNADPAAQHLEGCKDSHSIAVQGLRPQTSTAPGVPGKGSRATTQLLAWEALLSPLHPIAAMLSSDRLEGSLPRCRICSAGSTSLGVTPHFEGSLPWGFMGWRRTTAFLCARALPCCSRAQSTQQSTGAAQLSLLMNMVAEQFRQLFRQVGAADPYPLFTACR